MEWRNRQASVRERAVDIVSSSGDPRDVLHNVAERVDAELIVIVSHKRRGIEGTLLGSQTVKLIDHMTIPTLVVQ